MNITVGINAGFSGGVNCSVIETYEDLKDIVLKCNKIGVMAGVSTPKKSIDDVVKYLERYK